MKKYSISLGIRGECKSSPKQDITSHLSRWLRVLVVQLCLTLRPRGLCSLPGSSVHGILQAIMLEWIAIHFSRGSSWPQDQIQVSWLQADSLPSEPPGKPEFLYSKVKFLRAIQLQPWRGEVYQSKPGLLGRENWNKPSNWIDFWILHVIEPKEEIHLVHNRKCEQYQSNRYIGLVWHLGLAVYRRCQFSYPGLRVLMLVEVRSQKQEL